MAIESPFHNEPAAGVSYFTPAQHPPAGTAVQPQPEDKAVPKLFQPIKIRGVEFPNRIFLSPLCQYSADNGKVTPWHFAHIGGIVTRGPGLTLMEATAVLPEGRITPQCTGIWDDSFIAPLAEIVNFAHGQNQKIGLQLAHAGRKASTVAPWLSIAAIAPASEGGWPDNVWGPDDVPWSDAFPTPKALTHEGIKRVVEAFAAAARRAVAAGFDLVEIHNAHGYLLNSFLSPASNTRTDEYGGSWENRVRLTLEVVDAVRAAIPKDMPLFLRISATDFLDDQPHRPSWRSVDTERLAPILAAHGVDLLDVSGGGNASQLRIPVFPAYQAHLAAAARAAAGPALLVGAVGGISSGTTAQEVLDKGQADVVFCGRWFQKNPGLVWQFAEELGVNAQIGRQIGWWFIGRGKSAKKAEWSKTYDEAETFSKA